MGLLLDWTFYCATPFSPYLLWLNRFDSMVLKHLIAAHSRALFGSKKIRNLSKRARHAQLRGHVLALHLHCACLASRAFWASESFPGRDGHGDISTQEEQKSVKMLGEPLEWSH